MFRFFLVVGIAALTQIPCQARLGETFEQCVARYGKPDVDRPPSGYPGEKFLIFTKNNFNITVVIYKGIVGFEKYRRVDAQDFSIHVDFDDSKPTELDTILAAEADSMKWAKSKDPDGSIIFTRDDGVKAVYHTSDHTLGIFSKYYLGVFNAATISKQ